MRTLNPTYSPFLSLFEQCRWKQVAHSPLIATYFLLALWPLSRVCH